jgi:hypothetical protein
MLRRRCCQLPNELGRGYVHFSLNDISKLGRGHVQVNVVAVGAAPPMVNGECCFE